MARVNRYRIILFIVAFLVLAIFGQMAYAQNDAQTRFKHIPMEYIVALGDPNASEGDNAQIWGLWHQDPGPRGCLLDDYEKLKAAQGVAPAQWTFDSNDWWLEEHGLIMEKPEFPLPPGKYVVTGGREVTAILTVSPMNDGKQRWALDQGAKLYDVTHLPCHAARYRPTTKDSTCSPQLASKTSFPVAPGVAMPAINGCQKQDYSVLFVIGVADENN